MIDYMTVDELMDIASIDGDYNTNRVTAWRYAGIATIENATGYCISKDNVNADEDKQRFINVANIYLQEYTRSNYLAPNYPTNQQMSLILRLKFIADELNNNIQEQSNG